MCNLNLVLSYQTKCNHQLTELLSQTWNAFGVTGVCPGTFLLMFRKHIPTKLHFRSFSAYNLRIKPTLPTCRCLVCFEVGFLMPGIQTSDLLIVREVDKFLLNRLCGIIGRQGKFPCSCAEVVMFIGPFRNENVLFSTVASVFYYTVFYLSKL